MQNLLAAVASFRRLDRHEKIACYLTMVLAVVVWVLLVLQVFGVIA